MNRVEAHLIAAGGDPYAAARVSNFIRDDCPQQTGRWRLKEFSITEDEARANEFRAHVEAARHGGVGANRWVPEGRYVTLQRKKPEPTTPDETFLQQLQGSWETLMSDTPDEIRDHEDVIERGTGRVLVHGLGLGCVIAALHVKPDVEHIDVVEIDPDVIKLIGRYYATLPKVSIVRGDAMTYKWPKGARWDYVWHDIWAMISENNLVPGDAEYGISYDMMFDLFADRAERQGAWAVDLARERAARTEVEVVHALRFMQEWRAMSKQERADLLIEKKVTVPGLESTLKASDIRKAARASMEVGVDGFQGMVEECERLAEKGELEEIEAMIVLGYAHL